MRTGLMLIATLFASLLALPASAQPGPGMGGGMGNPGMMQGAGPRAARDCAQTPNPAACQARRDARIQAVEACRDKVGPERRQCMREQGPAYDCAKAPNPQRCAERRQAVQGCKGQAGMAMRQCMQQRKGPADCVGAVDPQRCELHQKARTACQDKVGPEHKACLYEQLKLK